jgi:hypoxanthine phosphoribosyltransferase
MKNSPAPFELVPLYDENRITERVRELASEIDAVYEDQPLVAVCVLKGAFIFFSDLARALKNPNLELDFVRLSSYGMNSESSKHVIFGKDIETDILNKHVLVVEDIVDSGHTMRFLLDQLSARGPKSLKIACLVDKYERREADIQVDFPGFRLSKGFIVGYGLDFAEKFRTLPCICEIVQK